MKHAERLSVWQVVLIILGTMLILLPIALDILNESFAALANFNLGDMFTRSGMFTVGVVLLVIVGIVEIVKDFRDKPKSKYIK